MALVTKRWKLPRLEYGPQLRYADVYDVTEVATRQDAIAAVVAAYPSTKYNAQATFSPLLYCDQQDAEATGFNFWTVTIGYASNPAGRHFDANNPLAEPTHYRFDWQFTTEGSNRDNQGNAIQNSAGQAFASDPPTDVMNGVMYATRNEAFYDVKSAILFSNAVNSQTVTFHGQWELEAGQARCRQISCLSDITGAEPYVQVQYVIELRGGRVQDDDGYWDGFKLRILNDGTEGWFSTGAANGLPSKGPLGQVIDEQFQRVSFPARLDPQGRPMDLGVLGSGGVAVSGTFVGCTRSKQNPYGYAVPAVNPDFVLDPTNYEQTSDAWFIKVWPETTKLLDLSALNL